MVSKNLPSISVLIPTLNAASVLGKCLKSIVEQDYPKNKIEIIIAHGGSTDKTLEIAKKYGRVKRDGAKIERRLN
ncbi:glycosyltransferase [Patescibacteria group bacterium]|nr:glycosyltransferase [Patescibacteria group bacterium]